MKMHEFGVQQITQGKAVRLPSVEMLAYEYYRHLTSLVKLGKLPPEVQRVFDDWAKALYNPAQKPSLWVDHAGGSTSVKPRLVALLRQAARSRSRARGSSSAALMARQGGRCLSR